MSKRVICLLVCAALVLGLPLPVFAREVKADLYITGREAFLDFAENCRLDSFSRDLTVSLEADIDLSGTDFAAIPIFCGTFLGNDHTISGVNITAKGSQQGLFRYLTQSARVQDLTVSGSIMPQGSRGDVGGIAGSNAGVIQNCVFIGEIAGGDRVGGIAGTNTVSGVVKNCRVEGSIHGNHFVGGIAGENAGVIRSCQNLAAINTTPQQNSVDISDITIGTITGTESANTATDIGGIAGSSSGTIRSCVNRGDVGYEHMGYNIGGIAGSQSGYLTKCQNYGAISGRKEAGGIVGHMEPSILLHYETDTVQILQSQMAVLGDLTDRAALNAQSNTAAIRTLITALENHTANAEAAIDVLTIDPENPEIQDPDTYIAALQTLSSSITGIGSTVRELYQAVKDTGDDLEADLQAVADQVDVINGILNNAQENLGGTLTDVSDADTPEDLTSKIETVVNHGPVLGDLNVGGIVGAIALESDLDPEEDVAIYGDVTLNAAGKLRSVVLDAVNNGCVTAKKQNAGGIAGWQSMGLVKGCINAGTLDGGDYTGGIAGRSQGYIRASFSRCQAAGNAYVGGIAGSGMVVTDCHSMVHITGSERTGAILGFTEENFTDIAQPIAGNSYVCVEADPGAIDGISYDTIAQAVELDVFMAMEALPEQFRTVHVTFRFEDGTVHVVPLATGSALPEADIPAVPAKTGFAGSWEGLAEAELENICFDLTFDLVYTGYNTFIQTEENRNGRPILLLQGNFAPDAVVTLSEMEQEPPLADGETLLESCRFSVTGGVHAAAARYLLPEGADADRLRVYVRSAEGGWRQTAYTVDGSYAAVALEEGDDGIAFLQSDGFAVPWLLIAGISGAAIAAVVIIMIVRRKDKKKEEKTEEASESEEP